MNSVSAACSYGDFLAGRSWRDDNRAIAVWEEDVGTVRFRKARRGLEELFSVHDLRFCRFIDFPGRPRFYLARGAAEWAGDVELARVACPMPGIAGCLARLATWAIMLDRNSCDTRFLSDHCRSSPMWVGEVVAGRVACWAAWIAVCLVQLAVRAPKP